MSEADWDRLRYYSRKVKSFEFTCEDDPPIHSSTYFRIGQLQSSALFPSLRCLYYHLDEISISHIFLFLSPLLESLELYNIRGFEQTIVGPFLATLSSQMVHHIVLRNGEMSVDILKKLIVHFKQLRSLELPDAVFLNDFGLWEVLGTLPFLEDLTLVVNDPESHPTHAPENSHSQSGGTRYFEALESLHVTGSSFLIQHLLGFIDSPCLKLIEIIPVINHQVDNELEVEEFFTPSMTIVSSKWSQSLKDFSICSSSFETKRCAISKLLILLKDFQNMENFRLDWRIKTQDDLKSLVTLWPKLRTLDLNRTLVTLSSLWYIAENCPELHRLHIRLEGSTIEVPPFDNSRKSLRHNLEVLIVGRAPASSISPQTMLQRQIKVTRHLGLMFPYLKFINVQSDDVFWSGIRDLVHFRQEAQDACLSRVE